MQANDLSTEQVLRKIMTEKGETILRDNEKLLGAFGDVSKGKMKKQENCLRTFLACQGNRCVFELRNADIMEQQLHFCQLVRKMRDEYSIQEDAALDICSSFWRVVCGTSVPNYISKNVDASARQESQASQQEKKEQLPHKNMVTPPVTVEPQGGVTQTAAKQYGYFDKPEYFISQEEAIKGGKVAVYYKDDMLYIDIPPNMPDKYEVRPVLKVRVVDAKSCSFDKRDERCYSDALIQGYIEKWYNRIICRYILGGLIGGAIFEGLIYIFALVLEWLLPWSIMHRALNFNSIISSVWSIGYIAAWIWPSCVAVYWICGWIRDELALRRKLQTELKRRKTLRHR